MPMTEFIERILIVVGITGTVIYYVLSLRFLGSPSDVLSALLKAVWPKSGFLIRLTMVLISVTVFFFVALGTAIFLDGASSSLTLLRVSVFFCLGLPILSWLLLGSTVLVARGKEMAAIYRNTTYTAALPRPVVTKLNRPAFEVIFLVVLVAYCAIEIRNQWQGLNVHFFAFLLLALAFLYRLFAVLFISETKVYPDSVLKRRERFLFLFSYEEFRFAHMEVLEDRDAIVFSDSTNESKLQIGFFEFSRKSVRKFVQMFGGR